MWSWTTRLAWFHFHIYVWFYKFRNWMSLNSRGLQMFKSCSFILSFDSCFNISEVSLGILLMITSNKSLLLLISSISAFWIMSSVTVLIALLNLIYLSFASTTKYSLLQPSSSENSRELEFQIITSLYLNDYHKNPLKFYSRTQE